MAKPNFVESDDAEMEVISGVDLHFVVTAPAGAASLGTTIATAGGTYPSWLPQADVKPKYPKAINLMVFTPGDVAWFTYDGQTPDPATGLGLPVPAGAPARFPLPVQIANDTILLRGATGAEVVCLTYEW